jgi:hypothetical protein
MDCIDVAHTHMDYTLRLVTLYFYDHAICFTSLRLSIVLVLRPV